MSSSFLKKRKLKELQNRKLDCLDAGTVMSLYIEVDQLTAFDFLLPDGGGAVVAEGSPLVCLLVTSVATNLPLGVSEENKIRRVRRVPDNV